jgi:hypothetical protein
MTVDEFVPGSITRYVEMDDNIWVIRAIENKEDVSVFMYGFTWDDEGQRLGHIVNAEVPIQWHRGVRPITGKATAITKKELTYLLDNPAQFMAVELL